MSGPLEGVRIVELGVWVAGPGAGGILADWGADVVKIEPPEGDPCRTFLNVLGGDLPSNPVFELDNRGKRAIALDLSSRRGVELAHQLVAEADVFLTNLRPAALERIGLGPDQVHERHPGLVYAIITGYGLEDPDAEQGAYDVAAFWARAGIAESLRAPGGPLPFQRGGMGDHSAAMTAAAMISAALVEHARSGRGQVVSTSLLRQGCYTIGFDLNVMLMWGRTLNVGVRETMFSPVVNNYTAGDGRAFWIVGLEGDRHWPALCRAVGHPEWVDDARFANEYFGLLGRGFVSIRIQAPDDKRELRLRGNGKWLDGYFDHEIEHYLDDVTPGYTIVNDGTTDELYDDVVKVLERERKRR